MCDKLSSGEKEKECSNIKNIIITKCIEVIFSSKVMAIGHVNKSMNDDTHLLVLIGSLFEAAELNSVNRNIVRQTTNYRNVSVK